MFNQFARLKGWGVACALLLLAACSPMTPDVVATLPPPTATPTDTPQPTATPLPPATPKPTSTVAPSATSAPTATRVPPTSAPSANPTPVGSSPVSQYFAALGGQVNGPSLTLTLLRAEFWAELTRNKPSNGMFLVLVGRFSSTTGQTACAHADDFRLNAGGRRYDTTSGEMDAFKPLYKINYPGSVLGQCLARTESTFLVFDVPQMPGAAKLTFGSNTLDLGDLTALVRKSGFPLPGTENQLRPTLEKLLPPSARIASRLLEFKLTDAPSPAGAKLATVSWVIEDTGDAVKNKAALKSEATALFKTLYTTAGLTVAHVEVNASLRTFDVYGNPKDALVAKLALDSATAAKINWANFQADNLYAVAKIIALDPILKD